MCSCHWPGDLHCAHVGIHCMLLCSTQYTYSHARAFVLLPVHACICPHCLCTLSLRGARTMGILDMFMSLSHKFVAFPSSAAQPIVLIFCQEQDTAKLHTIPKILFCGILHQSQMPIKSTDSPSRLQGSAAFLWETFIWPRAFSQGHL